MVVLGGWAVSYERGTPIFGLTNMIRRGPFWTALVFVKQMCGSFPPQTPSRGLQVWKSPLICGFPMFGNHDTFARQRTLWFPSPDPTQAAEREQSTASRRRSICTAPECCPDIRAGWAPLSFKWCAPRSIFQPGFFFVYTQVHLVIYDSGSVSDESIFSPRVTSPEACTKGS